ncbi:MAG: hypothetical protein ABIQ27_05795 [Flavobacterium sp.]|uniref:hypothetical protein n=1 Tax=Flavobacterium sp. TaxID=239 RepID=UPI0032678703
MLKILSGFFIIGSLIFSSNFIRFNKNHLKPNNDTIVWSGKNRLTWDDFKGSPDNPKVYVKANTASGIYAKQIRVAGKVKIRKYKIQSYFMKNNSWTKVHDEKVLKHEQLHFDITELYARKLRKSFDSLNTKGVTDKIVYEKIYNSNFTKANEYQDVYDGEVYFNEIKQQEWIDKIASEFQNFKMYELKE